MANINPFHYGDLSILCEDKNKMNHTCVDPESFIRGGLTFVLAKRHFNCVSLACR